MSDNAYFPGFGQLLFERNYSIVLNYPAVTATGTHGLYGAANAAGICTFTDTTAANFTAAMVGQTLTTTSPNQPNTNAGTFIIVGYTSATVITIYNAYGMVDTNADVWSVVPSPSIIAGDIAQAYITPQRAGTGLTVLTTTDPFPQEIGMHPDLSPSTGSGTWHTEDGIPVQNVGGFHPFFMQLPVTVNSYSMPFTSFTSSVAGDAVPTNVSGTHGAPVATASGSVFAQFVDSTANTFTPAMVGANITITGGTGVGVVNNGTFVVLGFINNQRIVISNPLAIAATGLSWTVTIPTTIGIDLILNNGPLQ